MNEKFHDILMIVYNRAEYTEMALSRLLESCDASMRVWIWQNGGHQRTAEVVRSMRSHPRFHHLEVSPENLKLRAPTNWFWRNTDGAYLSKVDDDCLLPDGWGATLRASHEANPRIGIIGCWRFYDEDFVPSLALRKVVRLDGGSEMMRNPWVQGSGYVMKRECFERLGELREGESFPAYCIRSALAGWENGWAFPFIHEEHMDDPRSPYSAMKTEADFQSQRPLSAINDGVRSLAEWKQRVKYMARVVQAASPDPRAHAGIPMRIKNLKHRARKILRLPEPWQVA